MDTAETHCRKIVVCIPILNDWESVVQLVPRIDRVFSNTSDEVELLIVDDGSEEAPPSKIQTATKSILRAEILHLRRNLGHQRAIAIGLSYIQAKHACDAVVVMDGDGEDPPEGISVLLAEYTRWNGSRLILAQRGRRSEGFRFRTFYSLYRVAHRLLTGYRVQAGNFCVIPAEHVDRLVGVSAIWNHFASAVVKSRIPHDFARVDRFPRIAGRTKMSFISLLMHGLSAISVFSDILGLRLLILTFCMAMLALLGVVIVVFIRLATDLAIPGWASQTAGIFVIVFLQAFLMAMVFMFITLQDRKGSAFLPVRDYHPFIYKVASLDLHE